MNKTQMTTTYKLFESYIQEGGSDVVPILKDDGSSLVASRQTHVIACGWKDVCIAF
jgi:hypothetical protein